MSSPSRSATWSYENGRLLARDEAGKALRSWPETKPIEGALTALALNQLGHLGELNRKLLWPLLEPEADQSDSPTSLDTRMKSSMSTS